MAIAAIWRLSISARMSQIIFPCIKSRGDWYGTNYTAFDKFFLAADESGAENDGTADVDFICAWHDSCFYHCHV